MDNLAALTDHDLEVGICSGSLSNVILYQNKPCKEYCGDRTGQICREGCVLLSANAPNPRPSSGRVAVFRHRLIHNRYFDVVVLKSEQTLTTVLNPDVRAPASLLAAMEAADLTKREKEIVELMIQGLSNQEIIKHLHIAKATLKTHINRIYRKLGTEHQHLLLSRG